MPMKEQRKKEIQSNNLLSFCSPSKRINTSNLTIIEEENSFVFCPLEDEGSQEIIKKNKENYQFDNLVGHESRDNLVGHENSIGPNSSTFHDFNEKSSLGDVSFLSEEETKFNKIDENTFAFLRDVKDKNGIRKGEPNYDPTTLFIPEKDFNSFTDFEKQFWEIKKNYFDTIVFFKKGKFYELYEDDAELASKHFDLKMTGRVKMKMAGVPEKSYDYWANKFIEKGFKVARVDQIENMIGKNLREKNIKNKEKIIKRELKEIITQGTIYNPENLKTFNSVYLVSVYFSDNISIILYDACINKIYFSSLKFEEFKNLFLKYEIKELIYENKLNERYFIEEINKLKEKINVKESILLKRNEENFSDILIKFNEQLNRGEFKCLVNLLNYMSYLKREDFINSLEIKHLNEKEENFINLDGSTIKNLELLTNNYDNTQKNSLFSIINFCVTGNGQRLLKKYLLQPSKNLKEIERRQNLTKKFDKLNYFDIREKLKEINDLERIFGRLTSPLPTNKDIINFIRALNLIKEIQIKLKEIKVEMKFSEILIEFYKKYFIEENEIFPEKNADDELNILKRKENEIYFKLTEYLKKQEKILNTVIKFKDIGKEIFQLELINAIKVPNNYFLVSSTKNLKRYYTEELKELVNEYKENEELIFQSKGNLLRRVVTFIMEYKMEIDQLIEYLSELDVIFSFSFFSKTYSTVFPVFTEKLEIKGLRNLIYNNFVETDVNNSDVLVLTGPNMGGKSTLMRSVCYNVILAQMGMKVFANSFTTKVFDNIFTRMGASDDLEKGESTFFIELKETSNILKRSTMNSFIIMDELGRGTCVKDGKAIASAVLNYLKRKGCTLFFSTHYFDIVDKIMDVNKGFMEVELNNEEVNFKYKLISGVSKDSLGISVAKIANVPLNIIEKALEYRNAY